MIHRSHWSWRARVWHRVTGFTRTRAARPLVRVFTGLHSRLYRLTGGTAQARAYPTLLLSVVGRKSGVIRTTPLVYITDGPTWIVAAAYSGAEENPSWWVNLRAAGRADVQIDRATTPVRSELIEGRDRDELWTQLCRMYPPFRDYETRTTRVFPVVRLTPARERT